MADHRLRRPPRSPGRHRRRRRFEERLSAYTAAGVAVVAVSTATYTMVGESAPAPVHRIVKPPPDLEEKAGPSSTAATPVPGRRPRQTRPATTPTRPPVAALSAPPESVEIDPPTPVPSSEPPECEIENRWGDVNPRVRQVACLLDDRYPGIVSLLGVAKRGLAGSGHPRGLAVDVVVRQDRVTGDAIAACAAAHFADWDLDYVLWQQASLEEAGGEFEAMADRGGDTANHRDHVHLSFHNRSEPIPAEALTCDDDQPRENNEP